MIIGKYFKKSKDYVNVRRVCKRYKDLVSMYHFNPIQDCSLFENMESQYLYGRGYEKKEGMHQYVYWYEVDYKKIKEGKDDKVLKRIKLSKNSLPIENGKCIVPEGVTSIGGNCFNERKSLISVELPSTLMSIGDYAFSIQIFQQL